MPQAVAPQILHIATHGFFLEYRAAGTERTKGLISIEVDGEPGEWELNLKVEESSVTLGIGSGKSESAHGGR
jgi:hypothetical protein